MQRDCFTPTTFQSSQRVCCRCACLCMLLQFGRGVTPIVLWPHKPRMIRENMDGTVNGKAIDREFQNCW
jgi:hypothetical protein